MTCNVMSKIPDAIISRLNVISYKPCNNEEEQYLIQEYSGRVLKILNHFKIEHTPETLSKLVKTDFPDMRKLIDRLQNG